MAVKKSSGETKIQDVSAAKKAGGKKSAAKKETAPTKSTSTCSCSRIVRIDTPYEIQYYRHGGILQYVLRQLIA